MLSLNGMPVGFIPQYGITTKPMMAINSILKDNGLANSSTYGYYAQTHPGVVWNGNQLLWNKDDIVASNAIFEPAVMPATSWQGYTDSDNSQAVAVAKVMAKFTDAGVDVRLR